MSFVVCISSVSSFCSLRFFYFAFTSRTKLVLSVCSCRYEVAARKFVWLFCARFFFFSFFRLNPCVVTAENGIPKWEMNTVVHRTTHARVLFRFIYLFSFFFSRKKKQKTKNLKKIKSTLKWAERENRVDTHIIHFGFATGHIDLKRLKRVAIRSDRGSFHYLFVLDILFFVCWQRISIDLPLPTTTTVLSITISIRMTNYHKQKRLCVARLSMIYSNGIRKRKEGEGANVTWAFGSTFWHRHSICGQIDVSFSTLILFQLILYFWFRILCAGHSGINSISVFASDSHWWVRVCVHKSMYR